MRDLDGRTLLSRNSRRRAYDHARLKCYQRVVNRMRPYQIMAILCTIQAGPVHGGSSEGRIASRARRISSDGTRFESPRDCAIDSDHLNIALDILVT